MRSIRAIWAIFIKELTAERRAKELAAAMLVFALLVVILFVFAFDLNADIREAAAPGVLWTTICFAGTLGLNRSMAAEREQGGLDGLLLVPDDRSVILFGKALANWVFLLIVVAIILPVYSLFSNVNLLRFSLAGVILLGTVGYILTGTLLSALTVRLRTREMLLPVILFPVMIPLFLASLRATSIILQGGSSAEMRTWMILLTGFDLIILAAGWMTFDAALED